MKLTRMFVLKALDEDYKKFDNNDPANSLERLIVKNNNIDILIYFIFSFLFTISLGFIDSSFYQKYPFNFIPISRAILFISFLYIIIESFRIIIITWEKYIRSLNKPQDTSNRSSIKSNLSNKSGNNNNKKRIEMDEIDEKKNPFLSKDKNSENVNYENDKYDINENIKNKIINNKKNYIEIYYEPILLSPLTTIYDKIFIKLYIYLIKKLNEYLTKNESYINDNQKKLSLYLLIIKYPHTLSSIIHFIKFILFIFSYGLSFMFWILFVPHKMQLKQYSFNVINIFIGECLSLYCLFRLCYFLIKFVFSSFFCPVYLSSLYLGYYEDKINETLNELINTRIYIDENSLMSRDSINKYLKDEILTSCAICLDNFVKGDVISTLPCSKRHTFHSYCLEEWFNSNILCPLCRYDFSKEFGMLFPDGNNNNNEQENIENNVNNNNEAGLLQNIINNINNININVAENNELDNIMQQNNNNIQNNNNNGNNNNNNGNNNNKNNNMNNNQNNQIQNIEMNELNVNIPNNNNNNNNNAGNNHLNQ